MPKVLERNLSEKIMVFSKKSKYFLLSPCEITIREAANFN
jgi:hypothetical protein